MNDVNNKDDTKPGLHCGLCKMYVERWDVHCETEEHKKRAAEIQPIIDRVLNGTAGSVEEVLNEQEELAAARKRIEANIKDLKLKVEKIEVT